MGGMESNKQRSEESELLMEWGFREFKNYTILHKNQQVANAKVWYGKEHEVPLTVSQDVLKTLHNSRKGKVKVTAIYDEPLKAPILKGQKVGELKIEVDAMPPVSVDLVAQKDVKEVGLAGRFWANMKYFISGAK
jgi:D-alanyl-D-alanine carboxypeptidase (penicillin-binding protein 5/6)